MNIVILNKKPRLVELPNVPPKVSKNGKVEREGFTAYRLLPGENDVPSEYWDLVKGNPGVKILLATEIIKNKGEGKAKTLLAGLDNLSGDVALKHVGNCENIQVLNDWKSGTENLGLRKAIDERVLELIANQTGDAPSDAENVEPVIPATLDE